MNRNAATEYALVYASLLPYLTKIANDHGYALAIHGSMSTDFDLLACPWIEEASEPDMLIEALRAHIGGYIPSHEDEDENPVIRPHGRKAWTICLNKDRQSSPYLDISVIPKRT